MNNEEIETEVRTYGSLGGAIQDLADMAGCSFEEAELVLEHLAFSLVDAGTIAVEMPVQDGDFDAVVNVAIDGVAS